MRILLYALPLAIVVAGTAGLAIAPPPASHVHEVGQSAMRATIDPETGELVVSSGQVKRLELDPETANALRRDDAGLREVHHPNGAVRMRLEGRYQNASVVRLTPEGKVISCSNHANTIECAGHPAPEPAEVK